MRHCTKVLRSCKTPEQLNNAYRWAVNVMIDAVKDAHPCNRFAGFFRRSHLRRQHITVSHVSHLIKVRTRMLTKVWT